MNEVHERSSSDIFPRTRLIRGLSYDIFGQHANSMAKGEHHALLNRTRHRI